MVIHQKLRANRWNIAAASVERLLLVLEGGAGTRVGRADRNTLGMVTGVLNDRHTVDSSYGGPVAVILAMVVPKRELVIVADLEELHGDDGDPNVGEVHVDHVGQASVHVLIVVVKDEFKVATDLAEWDVHQGPFAQGVAEDTDAFQVPVDEVLGEAFNLVGMISALFEDSML